MVNTAQRRLIYAKEAGDEGWFGSFAEVQFNGLSRSTPYITLCRQIARIQAVNVCNSPMTPHNIYMEYLDFGNGRMPKTNACLTDNNWCVPNVYSRNNAVTFVDLPSAGMYLRAYTTNNADIEAGRRIFFQGTDDTDTVIYSQEGVNQVQGVFATFESPFVQTATKFNSITGIQKDITAGDIQIFAVNATTGDETLLLTMEPGEQVAGYRRYYFHNLPTSCCAGSLPADDCAANPSEPLQVKALVKLELVPVVYDTDYLLLHNLEAIIEEAQSIRLSEVDSAAAKQDSAFHHQMAVRLLNAELVHYYGKDSPAVNFAPFGSATLERLNISMM